MNADGKQYRRLSAAFSVRTLTRGGSVAAELAVDAAVAEVTVLRKTKTL
jgi:hypothetical protein